MFNYLRTQRTARWTFSYSPAGIVSALALIIIIALGVLWYLDETPAKETEAVLSFVVEQYGDTLKVSVTPRSTDTLTARIEGNIGDVTLIPGSVLTLSGRKVAIFKNIIVENEPRYRYTKTLPPSKEQQDNE